MKKIISTTAMLVFVLGALAQSDVIDKYFSVYNESDDFTKVSISSKMFELFTNVEADDPDQTEVISAISKLTGMRMLVNSSSSEDGLAKYKKALKSTGNEYEVLMTVDDKDDDITFYVKEKNGIIQELVMIGNGGGEFFILSLLGDIDLKQINKLAKSLQMDGMEHLEKLEDQ
ncbi:MAG: hypothetical protein ACJAV7_001122 [Flavobacteriales bacterium]|jgi:hypothetical protein